MAFLLANKEVRFSRVANGPVMFLVGVGLTSCGCQSFLEVAVRALHDYRTKIKVANTSEPWIDSRITTWHHPRKPRLPTPIRTCCVAILRSRSSQKSSPLLWAAFCQRYRC